MKYIDADRLKAEIEKRMHICDGIFERDSDTYYQGKAVAYQETLSLIDSLQQEQPSLPSNLDEAAHNWAMKDSVVYISRKKSFKAGAEWMAEQGVNARKEE